MLPVTFNKYVTGWSLINQGLKIQGKVTSPFSKSSKKFRNSDRSDHITTYPNFINEILNVISRNNNMNIVKLTCISTI